MSLGDLRTSVKVELIGDLTKTGVVVYSRQQAMHFVVLLLKGSNSLFLLDLEVEKWINEVLDLLSKSSLEGVQIKGAETVNLNLKVLRLLVLLETGILLSTELQLLDPLVLFLLGLDFLFVHWEWLSSEYLSIPLCFGLVLFFHLILCPLI